MHCKHAVLSYRQLICQIGTTMHAIHSLTAECKNKAARQVFAEVQTHPQTPQLRDKMNP